MADPHLPTLAQLHHEEEGLATAEYGIVMLAHRVSSVTGLFSTRCCQRLTSRAKLVARHLVNYQGRPKPNNRVLSLKDGCVGREKRPGH